eukprot:scaffold201835_cov14-Tisochrysis_lutea.AAC.1
MVRDGEVQLLKKGGANWSRVYGSSNAFIYQHPYFAPHILQLIVKLNNLSTPDHIPKKGIAELQHKLQ